MSPFLSPFHISEPPNCHSCQNLKQQKTWYCNFGSDFEIMILFFPIRSEVSASKIALTHPHTHTHTHTHANTNTHLQPPTHAHTNTHTPTQTHNYNHTHTHTHTLSHTLEAVTRICFANPKYHKKHILIQLLFWRFHLDPSRLFPFKSWLWWLSQTAATGTWNISCIEISA